MKNNGHGSEADFGGAGERKRVSVLGATGTIGQHTCDLLALHPDRFQAVALTANRNAHKLASLAVALKAEYAALADASLEGELRRHLEGTGIECGAGPAALVEAGARPADLILASIVGSAGLAPTVAALRQGTTVALANKECLVSAGTYFMKERARCGTTLIPVDSEHSAVFQSLDSLDCAHVERIVLTASGGPFRTWTIEQIAAARPEDALKHPNWTMGQKITIDSATMMNKGLELIEAFHLFNVEADQLSAVIHPQSIIHALVYYSDGSVIAQASLPDMRTPIAYSLAWPHRLKADFKRLDLAAAGTLTFYEPDDTRFPALKLAKESLKEGGAAPPFLTRPMKSQSKRSSTGRHRFPASPRWSSGRWTRRRPASRVVLPDSLEAVMYLDGRAREIAKFALAEQSGAAVGPSACSAPI